MGGGARGQRGVPAVDGIREPKYLVNMSSEIMDLAGAGTLDPLREGSPAHTKRPLKELLLAIPPVGEDSDFERDPDRGRDGNDERTGVAPV